MNQHYVPRVYLKNFAEKRGTEYFVDVFNKESNSFFPTNIKKICAGKDFYTLDDSKTHVNDSLAIEKLYAKGFEPMYDRVYKLLTNENIIVINDLQRAEILLATFQLYMRNPRILNLSIQTHKVRIEQLVKEAQLSGTKGITYLEEDFAFSEWNKDLIIAYFSEKTTSHFKEQHIGGIRDMGTFHERAKFEVTKAINDSFYFTSDNPMVVEDLINPDEHPLVKSNEFILTLDVNYSLRIFHDNKIGLNTIARTISPMGNTGSRNHTVYAQAQRFVIGNKKNIEDFFKINSFLDDTSLKPKIDAMRQIVEKFLINADNGHLHTLFKEYLHKYDEKGSLTFDEEQELLHQVRALSINWKRGRL